MTARGLRNNNPGNIDYNGTNWQGLDDPMHDGRFCRFKTPTYGIRALARVLIAYYDKHGLNTVERIINRWAPPVENDTESYIVMVCKTTGFSRAEKLNLHRFEHLEPIVKAIIKHENGVQPYTQDQITKALVLAGVEPSINKPLMGTKTMIGGQVATAGMVGGAGVDTLTKTIGEATGALAGLTEYSEYIKSAFVILSIVGIALVMYARWDDRRKGIK